MADYVYVVWTGEYGSISVDGVFATEELAQGYITDVLGPDTASMADASVEEMPLLSAPVEKRTTYSILALTDAGPRWALFPDDRYVPVEGGKVRRWASASSTLSSDRTIASVRWWHDKHGPISVSVYGHDEADVERAFAERWAAVISGAWAKEQT